MKNSSKPNLLEETNDPCTVFSNCLQDNPEQQNVNSLNCKVNLQNVAKIGKTSVSCIFCKMEFETFSAYKCHVCCASVVKINDSVEGTVSYACLLCRIGFSHMSLLQKHLSTHRRYKCNLCHSSFVTKKAFNKHLTAVHCVFKTIKKYTCKHCEKCFVKRRLLHSHLKEHASNKVTFKIGNKSSKNKSFDSENINSLASNNNVYFCKHCNQCFKHKHQYEQHMMGHKQHTCSLCKTSFSTKRLWCKHQHAIHGLQTENRKHKCPICHKLFQRPIHLVAHQRVHTGEKPHHCHLCRKSFCNEGALAKHKKTAAHFKKEKGEAVEVEKAFLCEECGCKFSHQQTLARHTEQIHRCNKKFLHCPHCEYETKYEANLKRHVALHENIKRFICEICGASFHAQAALKEHHSYIHSDKRDFVCELCHKGFKGKSALQRHFQNHSADRPFKCHCNLTYKRMSHLKRHMASAHQIAFMSKPLENNNDVNSDINPQQTESRVNSDSQIQADSNFCTLQLQNSGLHMSHHNTEKVSSLSSIQHGENQDETQYGCTGFLKASNIQDLVITKSVEDSNYSLVTLPTSSETSISESAVISSNDVSIPTVACNADIKQENSKKGTSPNLCKVLHRSLSEPSSQNDLCVTIPETVFSRDTSFPKCEINPPTSDSFLHSSSNDYDSSALQMNSLLMNANFQLPECETLYNRNKSSSHKSLFDDYLNSFPLFTCGLESPNNSDHLSGTAEWSVSAEDLKTIDAIDMTSSELNTVLNNSYSVQNAPDICCSPFLFPSESHLSLEDTVPQIKLDYPSMRGYAEQTKQLTNISG